MEKKVTKEEVERVLEQYLTPITKEPILNELFPPEFKVGEKVVVIPNDGIREISSIDGNKFWFTTDTWEFGCNLRHATPEEIAAAEWESGKPYKVWSDDGRTEYVRISSDTIGEFYACGHFSGGCFTYTKYEKL